MEFTVNETKTLISVLHQRKYEIVEILLHLDDLELVAEYHREFDLLKSIMDKLFDD